MEMCGVLVCGMIVSFKETPGNEHNGVVMARVLEDEAGAVIADKAFDLPNTHKPL